MTKEREDFLRDVRALEYQARALRWRHSHEALNGTRLDGDGPKAWDLLTGLEHLLSPFARVAGRPMEAETKRRLELMAQPWRQRYAYDDVDRATAAKNWTGEEIQLQKHQIAASVENHVRQLADELLAAHNGAVGVRDALGRAGAALRRIGWDEDWLETLAHPLDPTGPHPNPDPRGNPNHVEWPPSPTRHHKQDVAAEVQEQLRLRMRLVDQVLRELEGLLEIIDEPTLAAEVEKLRGP
jgi:hypothetical protein